MPTAYRERAPAAALARWVECSWTIATPITISGYPVRPDGCLDILFSREQGARVVGTMTTEQRFDFPAGARMAGVRFRPGMAARFLKVAPEELTDDSVSIEEIWGRAGRDLATRLNEARSADDWIQLMTARLPIVSEPPNPVQRAIEAMTAAHGCVDLDLVARQANLSPRQFRRRCLEESGLTPKHLCRVLRFRRACGMAGRGEPEWSTVAAEAGYFDQAHLIRDFREFTGQTPMSVFSNTGAGAAG